MNRFLGKSKEWILILLLVILTPSLAKYSETNVDKIQIPITTWLKIGPIESSLPVFHNIKNIEGKEFDLKSLLKFEYSFGRVKDSRHLRAIGGCKI